MRRTIRLPRRAALLAGLCMPALARAQARRPLRLIIPFPPGGAVDTLGRLMVDRLAALLEQTVVVENRGGAGGMLGADAVAKGPPDGTMIGILGVTQICAAQFMQQNMPFDPQRDLRPVTQVTDTGLLLAVEAARATEQGWRDMAALLAWARANPGRLRLGHSGTGSITHLALAALIAMSGADITAVPYRGGNLAATDTLAGTIDGLMDAPAGLIPHLESGRMRGLGVTSGTRLRLLPEMPAMAETAGLEAMDIRSWNAVMAPRGTPDAEIARLHAALRTLIGDPAFANALRPLGWEAVASATPQDLVAKIAAETPRWRLLVEISGAAAG